jgi:hypothetical protein
LFTGIMLHRFRARSFLSAVLALMLLLASCGGDEGDTDEPITADPDPTPTQALAQETQTPEPTATVEAPSPTSEPDPTPTEEPIEPTPEPAEDVDLAPELVGLTDWRNIDPVTLEDLRGEPVILVFWNSI